jgi:hypothetical protein
MKVALLFHEKPEQAMATFPNARFRQAAPALLEATLIDTTHRMSMGAS